MFFFFQAEDGIRDYKVTGVQTCALPIFLQRWERALTALESDPMSLANELDWVAKYQLLRAYRDRHDLEWNSARLKAMEIGRASCRERGEKGVVAVRVEEKEGGGRCRIAR